jgi:acyl-CoA thioesterase I
LNILPRALLIAGMLVATSLPGAALGQDSTTELPARCAVSASLRSFGGELPHAREALRDGKALTIVALGSSSTAGTGASSDQTTYPAVLQAEMQRLLPGHEISVINRGVGGNSAMQMYHRMDDDVLSEEPSLVIWQTGVNDAIGDIGLERFKRMLRKGIAKLREANVDVVLMDHQPLPRVERYPAYADYLAALREVAAETGTPVYRRYDVMTELLRDGRLRQDEIFSSDALHMVDGSYFCVGATLARSLVEKLAPRAAGVQR